MIAQNFSKQIPRNLFINIVSFMATIGIGIWLTPYLLGHLGIVAYGLIPLAMFLSQYVSVIINAINMSINRFLLIELQKENDDEANEIFNTALIIILVFILIQALIMLAILWDITQFFTIPSELIVDATWLFGLTFVGFSISLFRSIFGTSMFAYNRLDILRIIDIVQNVVRAITIIILFTYDTPSLKYIGIANLLASMSAVVPTLYYFKKYTPQLKVNMSFFSKHRVSELSSMSMWILISQIGVLLLGNIDLYLVNVLLGSKETGDYAIVLQFTSIFRTFSILLSSIFIPISMIYYANNEIDRLIKFTILASKIMLIGLIIPLVFLVGFSEYLLELWLGLKYIYLANIISFSMLFFIFTIPIVPLFNITVSFNKVKVPALIALFLGVISAVSIYLLASQKDFGLWTIVSVKLVLEIIFSISIIIYVAILLKIKYRIFLSILFASIIVFMSLYTVVFGIKYFIEIDTIYDLFWIMVVLQVTLMPVMTIIVLSKYEKKLLANTFKLFKKLGW